MLDYQRIVDDVRSSLFSHSDEGMDFLRAAAADYSVACDEINERLRQCGSLLRRGLRSEAIQLAEIDPNLLDTAAILDFPEREQWIELAKQNGIAPPTPLLLDVAADLNEAYALEQPLAVLLQRHRLLALAHGPLMERIHILRQLAERDADNPVWQEDLRAFEQERQKQIQEEVKTAERAGDTAKLDALDSELSSPEWKNPPSPELAQSAAQAKLTLQYWAVQSQLDRLAGELESAMSSGRPDLGKTYYAHWNEIIAGSGWQPHERLAERAARALKWVRDLIEHETAVSALTEAVKEENSAPRLRELHGVAIKYGKLPKKLDERYLSRLAVLERAARRLWCMKLGAAGVAGVVVMLAIGWIVSHERYEQKVSAAEKNLPYFIERGDLERAESLVRELPERVKRDPRLQNTLILLDDKLKHDNERQEKFSQRLKTALHWLEEVQKSLAAEPGQTVLGRLREELERINSDLAHADKLARTKQERDQLASAEDIAAQVKDKWQRQLDRAFLDQYEDFDKQLAQLERDTHSTSRELDEKINGLKDDLHKWKSASRRVTPALVTRIDTLEERVASLDQGIQQRVKEERDKEQITAAVGDVQSFLNALQEYSRHNPDSKHALDFRRVAEESLCWQAMAEWDTFVRKWPEGGLKGLSPSVAENQLALAGTVSDNFADCTECESVRKLLPYIKAVTKRDNGGERIEVPLKKLFADPLVADIWVIETDKGLRYYCEKQPQVGHSFLYLIGFDRKTRGTNLIPSDWEKAKVARAPQVAIAEKVTPMLKSLDDANWERSFCRMIAVIQADQEMDPVLKTNLLQQVLDVGARGSYCLEKAFEQHLDWFKEAGINAFANWLDPTDEMANADREVAAKKLESLPDVNLPIRAVAQDLKTKRRPGRFIWIGWLHRGKDGHWECLTNSKPTCDGLLYVVCRQASSERLELNAIGKTKRNTAIIDATGGPSLMEGRPVYLKTP